MNNPKVFIIEIIIFLLLANTIPYASYILLLSSIFYILYPYSNNQLIKFIQIPSYVIRLIAIKISNLF